MEDSKDQNKDKNNSSNWKKKMSELIGVVVWFAVIVGVLVFLFSSDFRMKTLTFLDDEILIDYGIRLTPETYEKNETIEVDDLSYIVGEHKFTEDAKLWEVDSPPNAKYLVLAIEVKNIGKNAKEIPEFKLIDENGKIYDSAKKNTTKLNPEVKIAGGVVFDVPMNHNYRLIISNGKSKPKAYVSLYTD